MSVPLYSLLVAFAESTQVSPDVAWLCRMFHRAEGNPAKASAVVGFLPLGGVPGNLVRVKVSDNGLAIRAVVTHLRFLSSSGTGQAKAGLRTWFADAV